MLQLNPGLMQNLWGFEGLSQIIGATGDGELLWLVPRDAPQYIPPGFSDHNRESAWVTSVTGRIGERVVASLLPGSRHIGRRSPYDITMPSGSNERENILVEVKTAQIRNRGVIRSKQIAHYQENADNNHIYLAQVFYRLRNGGIPSAGSKQWIARQFLPICVFVFPIPFVIYLINTIRPTGQNEATKFYSLTHHRANRLFEMVDGELTLDAIQEKYRSAVFTTTQLDKNPSAQLCIVDHIDTPHILGHMDRTLIRV